MTPDQPPPGHLPDLDIARIAWEANRAYCAAIGDPPQPGWDAAPRWERVSAVAGVIFHRHNPKASDARCHAERLEHEAAEGWRHGPTADDRAKAHPYHCPYDELPGSQRRKYALFRAVVRALLDS